MNVEMESVYSAFNLSRNKATKIMNELREMYGDDISDHDIIVRAYIKDNIINADEYDLLKYYFY